MIAPAMNTCMWQHPVTIIQVRELWIMFLPGWCKQCGSSLGFFQVNQLEAWGYKVLPTVEKTLVCGDKGLGAMAEVDTIVEEVKNQVAGYHQRNPASS